MLKKVTLYGELAEKYGKDWSLDVNSPGEAFKALDVNNIGFRQFVASSEERGVGYKVIVGKSYINDYSELGHPSGRQEIKIIPVILGAKNKGAIGMILLGALLIWQPWAVQSLATLAEQEAVAGLIHHTAPVYSSLALKLGGALLLSGVAAMLAPTPEAPDTADKPTNYGFDGATNTARQGYAIPVAYGQLLIGGTVISSGVSPEDYTP
jgi:predicted phage tail protein